MKKIRKSEWIAILFTVAIFMSLLIREAHTEKAIPIYSLEGDPVLYLDETGVELTLVYYTSKMLPNFNVEPRLTKNNSIQFVLHGNYAVMVLCTPGFEKEQVDSLVKKHISTVAPSAVILSKRLTDIHPVLRSDVLRAQTRFI